MNDSVDAGLETMSAESDRLKTFTTNFPQEVAKVAINYAFGKTNPITRIRGLTENAVAMLVESYLSHCQWSLVADQLLISCPNAKTQGELKANFQCLHKNRKLVDLLDSSGLMEVKEICLMYPVGNSEEPRMIIIEVR